MDTTYKEIPLLDIQPNPRQPRTVFDETEPGVNGSITGEIARTC
jgi:hypothetical protein